MMRKERMEWNEMRRRMRRTVRRAGHADKAGLCFKSLRHPSQHHQKRGAAVTDLQAILGHSNLATTQVYARMVDERMQASVRALGYGMETKEPGKVNEAM